MHVLSSEQFDDAQLQNLFTEADHFREIREDPWGRRNLANMHLGRGVCTLFYEPSTRTRASFEFAADYLGMSVVSTENAAQFSSAIKGETIEDTIRVMEGYEAEIIILRHHETGSALRAANATTSASIINAGDGMGEHPTQSLLDAYTIQKQQGRLDGLHVVMGGDLKQGRTARSLAKLLSMYPGNRMTFVSTPALQMAEDVTNHLDEADTPYEETTDMYEALRTADVVYWTRLQKERFEAGHDMPIKSFTIDKDALAVMPPHTSILHPLPRVDEISTDVDADPRAQYFAQAKNGLYLRMALLDDVLQDAV